MTHFPRLKELVLTLLASVKQLGSVVVILLFLIGVFAILGLQLFLGSLHNRCVLKEGLNMTGVLSEVCTSNSTEQCLKYRNILFDKDDTTAGSGIPYGMCSTFMFGGFRCPDEHFDCVEDAGSNPYVWCSSAQEYLHLRFSCFNARTTHYITNFALKHRYMGLIGFDNIFQSVRGV